MAKGRLGQPDPRPEGLLAHARRIAQIARRATDTTNGRFLIERTEEQYIFAIEAFDGKHKTREAIDARAELERFRTQQDFILHDAPLLLESSAFRKHFDNLAASKEVGQFFNGTDNID